MVETETETRDRVIEVLREVFDTPDLEITSSSNAQTVPGWDSMKHVMIIMAVEENFKINLSTREMAGIRNVGDLIAVVSNKISVR